VGRLCRNLKIEKKYYHGKKIDFSKIQPIAAENSDGFTAGQKI